ncbi:MAG: OmpH family outer membrane protein [Bacteroidales bacterium]|nr:OmpH family outer membrane protein [Bacteroidales bacterium]
MSEFDEIKVEPTTESVPTNENCECNANSSQPAAEKKSCKCKCGLIIQCILAAAVITLFILHFCGIGYGSCKKSAATETFVPTVVNAEPGDGSVLYVDLDSINEKYIYIKDKKAELETEMQKQEAAFKQRQDAFQKKYQQFQQNLQSGVLTEVQVQNTQTQLQAEYEKMENDYNTVINKLTETQVAVNKAMLDSLYAAAARVNQEYNSSYILTFQKDMPLLIYTDKTKDITEQVLFEMNKSFKELKK